MRYPKPKVGDTVYLKDEQEATVTKVGTKYFYAKVPNLYTESKVSLKTWEGNRGHKTANFFPNYEELEKSRKREANLRFLSLRFRYGLGRESLSDEDIGAIVEIVEKSDKSETHQQNRDILERLKGRIL